MNKNRFLCCDKYCKMLENACSFWLAFRYIVLICSLNVKSLSIVVPNNFSELLLLMRDLLMCIKVC